MLECKSQTVGKVSSRKKKRPEQTCVEACCSSEHEHRGVFEENPKRSAKINKQKISPKILSWCVCGEWGGGGRYRNNQL